MRNFAHSFLLKITSTQITSVTLQDNFHPVRSMDKISFPFSYLKNVVKMSGMNKKETSTEFEDDNDGNTNSQGRTKRLLVMKTLDSKLGSKINPREVKSLIRHGIPNSKRAVVWKFISGGRELLLANPGIYSLLLSSNELSQNSKSEKLIVKDLHRTLTSHGLFQTIDGPGHRSLHNVLKAYSVYDTEVGYTQGMNFIAGMILLYMKEEEAFWVMVALLKGMQIRGMYLEGLPLLHQYFFQFEMLVKEQLPELAKHFKEHTITSAMYTTSWFMTVFSADLPFPLAVWIWDVFLYEGMKAVFGLGLALLKFFEDDLLKLPFESLLPFLRGFPKEALDANTLIPMTCSFSLKTRLKELELEYLLSKDQTSAPGEENNHGGWVLINSNDKMLTKDQTSGSTENNNDAWIQINSNDKWSENDQPTISAENVVDGWIVINLHKNKKRKLENQ